jgi:hypothetical protein
MIYTLFGRVIYQLLGSGLSAVWQGDLSVISAGWLTAGYREDVKMTAVRDITASIIRAP